MILRVLAVALLTVAISGAAVADELPNVKPRKVDMSAARLERVAEHMQHFIDDGKMAGIVTLIARDGQIAQRASLGRMDFETNRPMREDAIFRIYSMTKPVVAVALMMLHEQGAFRLNEPISRYIPELGGLSVFVEMGEDGPVVEKVRRDATIRELLSHTAGFGYGLFPSHPVEVLYKEANVLDAQSTLAELIEKVAKLPLLYQPGEAWSYSVANDIQGRLVEVLSGLPLDRYMKERIFDPLDMLDTGFTVPAASVERFVSNYFEQSDGSGMRLIDAAATSAYVTGKTLFSGGGGLVSTARDYLRFAQMLANGGQLDDVRIVGRKTLELMTRDHLPKGVTMELPARPGAFAGFGYGLGFGVVTDGATAGNTSSQGSFWWGGAANTSFWVDPKERIVGVVMTQRFPGDLPLGQDLQTLTYQALSD